MAPSKRCEWPRLSIRAPARRTTAWVSR
jgi:hypothetical protein